MRFISVVTLFSLLISPISTFPQAPSSGVPITSEGGMAFGLPDGTPVKLRISRNLSSADAKTGETVDFEVLEEIKIGETIVVPRGGVAIGTVTRAKPKARLGRGGKLDLTIDYMRTSVGDKIALSAVKNAKGYSSTAPMTGAIVAAGILFFPAAPFFLFLKGKDIKIPKGTEVTAYVSGNSELVAAKYAAAQNLIGPDQLTSSSVGLANVSIKSDPEGADITINGNFVGNTPSSVYLKSGEHTIVIKKDGHKVWERFVRLEPGSTITLNATLTKN